MSLVKKDVKRNRTKRVDLKGLYAVPHSMMRGFDVWSGYHETRFLTRDDLSGKRCHNKKVLK